MHICIGCLYAMLCKEKSPKSQQGDGAAVAIGFYSGLLIQNHIRYRCIFLITVIEKRVPIFRMHRNTMITFATFDEIISININYLFSM